MLILLLPRHASKLQVSKRMSMRDSDICTSVDVVNNTEVGLHMSKMLSIAYCEKHKKKRSHW
jgi:hypothetical protein